MDFDRKKFESVYSKKVKAGKRRTYFFDVRQTKGSDYYLTITESTKRFESDGYERHKLFLYKEDFNRFLSGLEEVIDHVKQELLPDYDYDEFTRRHEEYEARMEEEYGNNENSNNKEKTHQSVSDNPQPKKHLPEVSEEESEPVMEEAAEVESEEEEYDADADDDIKW